MKGLFFVMFPFFLVTGFVFLSLSFYFINLNLSLFIQWDLFMFSSKISFPIFLDYMSCIFMGLVLVISGSIMFYSEFYMEGETYKSRFFFLMMFFVLSMIFLILCPNFICMLIGWDGLGLVSYCLVIYYQNFKSFSAGMITALTNRVGDVFILGTIGLFFCSGSWSYLNFMYTDNLSFVSLFFLIAAMTKSAQIPFSAWLPAAMAAPTPVSSLVHSSTLVTAGVYILIRFSYLLNNPSMKMFLISMALLTMVMSGISGVFEFDLKKIIALSTLSQLGFMMSTLALGLPDLTFFHLATHACFKALLFMCAGLFIHSFQDNQDIRGFGIMNKNFSLSLCMFNVANLSLSGFPFLSGFFSKDLILELVLMSNMNLFIFFLFMLGTFLTVFYSFRLMFYLSFKRVFYFSPIESNLKMLGIQKSMFILFIFSISFGFTGSKLMFMPYNYIVLPLILKLFISLICVSSFWISYIFSKSPFMFKMEKSLVLFLGSMWFLPFLKTDFIKMPILGLGFVSSKLTTGWVEFLVGLKPLSGMFFVSEKINSLLTKTIFFLFTSFMIFILYFSLIWS